MSTKSITKHIPQTLPTQTQKICVKKFKVAFLLIPRDCKQPKYHQQENGQVMIAIQ